MKLRKLASTIVVLGLVVGLMAGCRSQAEVSTPADGGELADLGEALGFQPGTFTDDAGREVYVGEVPKRIVSFGPSITEILFALGLDDSIVGVTDFCNYPEAAKAKPKVGSAFSPSIEKIVELEPDLVFTVKHEQLNNELDGLGITFAILDPKNVDGAMDAVRLAAELTGKTAEGEQLAQDMAKTTADVTARVKGAPKVKVLFIIDGTDLSLPWTAGPGSFIDDIINLAGGENIAAGAASDWAQLSIEEIVAADPDIIIIQTMTGGVPTVAVEVLEQHPIWQQLSAVKKGSVFLINGDLVSRPGPRIVRGLEEMAEILHPELFD